MRGFQSFPRIISALALCALAPLASASESDSAYESGLRAAEDFRYAAALQHFTQAAAQGHSSAMRAAGLMLLYGERLYGQEIRQDRTRALRLLGQAAAKGCEVSAQVLRQPSAAPRS